MKTKLTAHTLTFNGPNGDFPHLVRVGFLRRRYPLRFGRIAAPSIEWILSSYLFYEMTEILSVGTKSLL